MNAIQRTDPSRGRAVLSQPLLLSTVLATTLFAFGAIHISGFTARYSIMSLLTLASLLGIAACGQTLVVILGGIDLSIPFVIDFADVVGGELNGRGWPFWRTALLVFAIAAAFGAFNGIVASVLRVHPLIVTLGTGFALQGAVLVWNGGLSTGTSPGWLTDFVSSGGTTGPIPLPSVVVLWAVLGIVLIVMLRRTVFGRHVYALGSNPDAARLALVRPTRVWASAFSLSAMFSALAGLLLLGFTGSVYADVGAPYLFATVGAVVIGGPRFGAAPAAMRRPSSAP